MVVLGLDGFKKRWVGIALIDGRYHSAHVFDTVRVAVEQFKDAAVIAVDIPIGWPAEGTRLADV